MRAFSPVARGAAIREASSGPPAFPHWAATRVTFEISAIRAPQPAPAYRGAAIELAMLDPSLAPAASVRSQARGRRDRLMHGSSLHSSESGGGPQKPGGDVFPQRSKRPRSSDETRGKRVCGRPPPPPAPFFSARRGLKNVYIDCRQTAGAIGGFARGERRSERGCHRKFACRRAKPHRRGEPPLRFACLSCSRQWADQ